MGYLADPSQDAFFQAAAQKANGAAPLESAGAGAITGSAGGPVGAAIGAVAGLVSGLFSLAGQAKQKKLDILSSGQQAATATQNNAIQNLGAGSSSAFNSLMNNYKSIL